MARIVYFVNFLLIFLSWTAATASSDVDVSSSNAERSNISNSSSDAGSPISSGSESYLTSNATSSSNSSDSNVFSLRKRSPGICPKGKKKSSCPKHEVRTKCIQAYCIPQKCSERGRAIPCPAIAGPCKKGCVCASGYLRNSRGRCIPENRCPPAGKCPTNERYSSCIQGECRALNCTQKGKPIACPRLAAGACKNGCVCVEGTLRAENGSCIPEEECQICPVNEEFSNCTQAVCRQQTCKDKKMPLSCPAIKEGDCNSGCVCQSGYLRTPEGECMPQNQCSGDLVCKTNEVVDNCPNSGHGDCCPESEKDAKSRKQSKVITECEEQSCTCRFNYMRADNGTCIPAKDCPPFNCTGENEEFNPCPPLCPTDDCAQATPSGRCPRPGRIGIVLQCRADCRCKTGFWRKNGVCLPYSECPGICPINEEYSDCIQDVCRALNCSQKGKPIACAGIAEGSCEKGCICSTGFLRDEHGNCIPDDQCPAPTCDGQNEVLAECANGCDPINCPESLQAEQERLACCNAIAVCLPPDCRCRPDYRRDEEGSCIPIGDCPGICPENEEFSNCTQAMCRAQNCTQKGKPFACPDIAKGSCEKGCVCSTGFLRNTEGNCVPEDQCSAGKCPTNERYSSCIQGECRALNCTQKGKSIACPRLAAGACKTGCVCVEGNLRAENGSCIPEEECPICPVNEEFSNCTQAVCRQQTCKHKKMPLSCPAIKEGDCNSGCVCQSGYLRTPEGECIPQNQCSGDLVCKTNEVVDNCPNSGHGDCCPRSEKDAKSRKHSKVITECEEQSCTCRFNYMRADNGTCIPARDCPPFNCTGENEEFNPCPPLCPTDDCAQATPSGRCPLPGRIGIVLQCRADCRCKTGFWRKNGVCVPYSECPGICPINEEYSDCIQGVCRALNCTQKGKPIACAGNAEGSCEKGCICSTGFLRDEHGNCIPDDQCPAPTCDGENEVLAECANGCDPINCPESLQAEQERLACCNAIAVCLPPDCRCRPDYRRDEEGSCIPIGDCPGICPENEEFSNCTQAMCRAQNCTQKGKPFACPDIAKGSCEKGCVCSTGFLRNTEGNCVPEDQCSAGKCPTNERYSSCIQGECRALNCTQKGKSIACPRLAAGACKTGCVCVEGNLRAENGSCIPEEECPICPVNEEFSNCTQAVCRQQTCKHKKMPLSCPAIKEGDCNSGCVCQSGYLRTPEGECIPQNQCSGDLVCKTNEVVDNCPNSGHGDCCPRSEKDAKSRKHSKVITECEEQSCTCRFNYMRADNGTCIPARDCPPFNCTGENEEFNPCPPLCPTDDCAQATPSGRCPLPGRIGIVLQCRADCRCKTGFWRKNGVCVPYSECPGICPINEEYSDCIQGVCRALNCTQKGKPIACAGNAEGSCEKGCICSTGFLRDEHGNCIPDDQCPAPTCDGQNEVLAECANGCDPINCPESLQAEQERLACCNAIAVCLPPDCRCRPDYRRDEEGSCIPIGDCPGICPENEEFSNCTQAMCRAQNCTQKGKPFACPDIAKGSCEKGCVCSTGFLRNTEGNCVPEDQCSAGKCPTNERYSSCIQGECRALNCTQKGKSIACPRLAAGACKTGCVCVEGNLRAENGSCIPEEECPICPVNEEFSNCTQAVCRQQTCKHKKMPLSCPAIKEGDCNSGCVCQSGYLRTPEGECIPQNQCSGDLVCKTNEVVDNCPNSGHGDCCPRSEKDAKSRKHSKVITECEEQSCTCRFNYMRADNGTCIPARDCPPFNCTGENEEFNPCPPLCPTDDCAQATPSGRCPLPGRIGIVLQCRADCRCKTGFWRKNGVCVPYSECPGICPINEEYSDCIQGVCRALNCTQKGKPIACAGNAEGSCEKGCICSTGFLRDEHGNCIPDDQCPAPTCDGQNEVLAECANGCDPINCPESLQAEQERLACCNAIAVCLPPDCRCRPDYRRDEEGSCIPIGDCPGICPENEEFSNCTQAMCRAQNCTQKGKPFACPDIAKGSCEKGCVCSTGFLRNTEGNCVPEDQCSAGKCPTNERYSSCIQGECRALNCTQKGKSIACPRLAAGACKTGCVCVEGNLRAENGSCIPEEECPICPVNEEFSNCTQAVCRQQTCKHKKMPLSCPAIKEGDCNSGCVCQSGYLRTPEGECIPQNQCSGDLVCKTNEVVDNCPNSGHGDCCPRSEKDAKSRKHSKVITECEEQSCTCRFNYMRADNGTCIPARDCPPFNCTGENEEFNPCPPLCPTDDCAQATPSGRCPLPGRIGIVLQCRADCRCKTGFWRKNGVCVPYSECPGICPINEEYSDCIQGVCRALNCTQKGKPIACAGNAEGSCEKGCICSTGFLRDEHGNCIPDDQCPAPTCDGQNEVLAECANGCDPINCPESLQAEQERLACCNAIAVCLPPDCRCRPDYRRDEEGSCIPIGDCPGICPENEEFSNCTQAMCRAQNCTQKGKPIASAGIAEGSCEKGCVCSNGFLRDEHGNCIPDDQCPATKCDGKNEVLAECPNGCDPINCPESLKAEQERLAGCNAIAVCLPPDCRCRPDYRRDEEGSCIPIGDCPGICPENEEFSNCTQAMCRAQNCTQKGKPFACPDIAKGSCEKGCVCSTGFLRNTEGNCVPEDQCSAGKCPTNERYSSCIQGECRALNCTQKGKSIACPRLAAGACKTGCVCVEGNLRAENGSCIPEEECPICPVNEEFSNCTQAVCRQQTCKHKKMPLSCPAIKEGDCNSGCVCQSGYLRTPEGECIPQNQCSAGICPINEEYSDCIQDVCRALNCTQKGKPIACAGIAEGSCEKGCICSTGFLRDEHGNCIPDDQCPDNTNQH